MFLQVCDHTSRVLLLGPFLYQVAVTPSKVWYVAVEFMLAGCM